jgi:hypothetical protein
VIVTDRLLLTTAVVAFFKERKNLLTGNKLL